MKEPHTLSELCVLKEENRKPRGNTRGHNSDKGRRGQMEWAGKVSLEVIFILSLRDKDRENGYSRQREQHMQGSWGRK